MIDMRLDCIEKKDKIELTENKEGTNEGKDQTEREENGNKGRQTNIDRQIDRQIVIEKKGRVSKKKRQTRR